MRNTITYEWTLETLEGEDVVDSDFSDSLSFDKDQLPGKDLGLVRNVGNEAQGITDRSWAYVKDGALPEYFTDSAGARIAKVPERFIKELNSYTNAKTN